MVIGILRIFWREGDPRSTAEVCQELGWYCVGPNGCTLCVRLSVRPSVRPSVGTIRMLNAIMIPTFFPCQKKKGKEKIEEEEKKMRGRSEKGEGRREKGEGRRERVVLRTIFRWLSLT